MDNLNGKGKIKLFTSQSKIVLDTLEEKGTYHVKREFIVKKYGEVANVFLEPYNWFVNRAEKMVAKPEGAQYPIWLFTDLKYVEKHEDSHVLEIEVDMDKVILFSPEKWNRILNLSYLAENEKDREKYYKTLEDQGIKNELDIFRTNFYPHLRQQVRKSWERLFEGNINMLETKQAALWEVKKEWIISVN